MKKKSLNWFKKRVGKSIDRLVMPIDIVSQAQAKALYDLQEKGAVYQDSK